MINKTSFKSIIVKSIVSASFLAAAFLALLLNGQPTSAQSRELIFYPGADPGRHQTGQAAPNGGWYVRSDQPNNRFLTYGPYTTEVPAGPARVRFELMVDNNSHDDLPIAHIEVYDSTHNVFLAYTTITRKQFRAPGQLQDFTLDFINSTQGALEFRVYYFGYSYLLHSKTVVTFGHTPSFQSDPLGAFWAGQARFAYVRDLAWSPSESSSWTYVKDGQWYVFNRDVNFQDRPTRCEHDYARTVVRVSSDQGRTWSERYVVAEPNDRECAILDGSTYYDQETDTWHLLAQCLGSAGDVTWRLCHYTRRGPSPLGRFEPDPNNAVVDHGALWRNICGSGTSCPSSVGDEGTPEILYKHNGYFYVSFHGYDRGPQTGYRGVAKTRNFKDWITHDHDLPGDAMFGPSDCRKWPGNHNCIGGGEATTVVSGGYHYMLIEGPDTALTCNGAQFWVFGLMRSPRLARSGEWESYPMNPLLKPLSRKGCGLQYARFIKDGNRIFLMYEDFTRNRRMLYQLVEGRGEPIENPDRFGPQSRMSSAPTSLGTPLDIRKNK